MTCTHCKVPMAYLFFEDGVDVYECPKCHRDAEDGPNNSALESMRLDAEMAN